LIDLNVVEWMFEKIMVPTDGSEYAARAEDIAIELAGRLGAVVVAVHVIDEKLIYPFEVGVVACTPGDLHEFIEGPAIPVNRAR